MVRESDWELLGRHSQVPDWATLSRSSLTELQLCHLSIREVTSQADLTGSGELLKYQKM